MDQGDGPGASFGCRRLITAGMRLPVREIRRVGDGNASSIGTREYTEMESVEQLAAEAQDAECKLWVSLIDFPS